MKGNRPDGRNNERVTGTFGFGNHDCGLGGVYPEIHMGIGSKETAGESGAAANWHHGRNLLPASDLPTFLPGRWQTPFPARRRTWRNPPPCHCAYEEHVIHPHKSVHQRPRLLQKNPPPPNNSTRTTMIKRVSVDIYANHGLGKDHALLGVSPIIDRRKNRRITRSPTIRLPSLPRTWTWPRVRF